MPLKHILKNKLFLQKHYNLQEVSINSWPFWMFEENIKIINEIAEQEKEEQKKQEKEQQSSMGGFNPNSIMKDAGNITKNMPNFNT